MVNISSALVQMLFITWDQVSYGLSFQESGNCHIWSWWCIANIDCAGIWSGFDILWWKVYSIIISELSGIILGIDMFPGNYEDFKLNDRVFKFVKVQYFCMSLHISVLLKTFVAHSLKKNTNKQKSSTCLVIYYHKCV